MLVAGFSAIQANASILSSCTPLSCAFVGFPSDPFVQQDKTWSGWTDVLGNLPAGFTTLIVTHPGIPAPGEDTHTFSLSGAFLPNTTYEISYQIMVNLPGVSIVDAAAGVVQTLGGGTITETLTNIPFALPTTSSSTGQLPIGSSTLLTVDDVIKTGPSDVTAFSNSFTELVSVPEPGALALFGTGVLALAGVLRRKLSH
jgi:hypothetical protein